MSDLNSVFSHLDFKKYLERRLAPFGASRGMRLKLAELLKTRPSYVSKILAGDISLAPEHAFVINQLLQHTEEESEFFFLLVQYTQAGTKDLENYLKKKIQAVLESRRVQANWIKDKTEIPEVHQAKYFSEWHYGVIHVLIGVPGFQTKAALSERLKLSRGTVTSVLDFLVQNGLAENRGDHYKPSATRMHLKKDSAWISHYHANVRQMALRSFTEPNEVDFHYSFVMSLSYAARDRIRKKIAQWVAEVEEETQGATVEDVCTLSLDFFRVQ